MPAMQDPFGQMWKEYAYSDSRYMTSDAFVLCMETSTAVRISHRELPGKILTAWLDILGSALLYCGLHDHKTTSTPLSSASSGLPGSDIRRCTLLCH